MIDNRKGRSQHSSPTRFPLAIGFFSYFRIIYFRLPVEVNFNDFARRGSSLGADSSHWKFDGKEKYFPWKSLSKKIVSFHLSVNLRKVIFFLPEKKVFFPLSKLVVLSPWQKFSIYLSVFRCPNIKMSKNNFSKTVFFKINGPLISLVTHSPFLRLVALERTNYTCAHI